MSVWHWLAAALMAAALIGGLVAAVTETVRSWQIGAGRKTRIRRAGGKDALHLLSYIGGGHGRGRGGDHGGDGDGGAYDSGGSDGGGGDGGD